jgi:hypothetical protein
MDTKAKCCPKKFTCRGTMRQVLIRVSDWRYIVNVGIFDPALCTVDSLTFYLSGSTLPHSLCE